MPGVNSKRYSYLAFPPVSFSRLHGPWPARDNAPGILEISREKFRELTATGLRKWFKQTTGAEFPRPRNKQRVFPFGAPALELTSKQAAALRREFPAIRLVRNKSMLMASQPATPSTTADLWHLRHTGVEAARAAGWASQGEGVRVAVVDSGIDHAHPEFAGKFFLSAAFDQEGNMTGPVTAPSGEHGTHMAALIAGQSVGIAPAAELYDIQAFIGGETTPKQLLAALYFAAGAEDVPVINLSGGFKMDHPFLESAVAQILTTGKLLVCATGNTADTVACPANFDSPLSIGSVDSSFQVPLDSGSGSIATAGGEVALPEIVAPGVDVYSALPGGGYGVLTGTSPAAAIVSGLAALRISDRAGNLSLADLIAQLTTHTRTASPGPRAGRGSVFYNRIA